MSERERLTREIIQLQQQLAHAMGRHAPEAWLDMDLTIGQLKSLFFIAFEGSTNVRTLAAALGVTSPNITGIIDRLVERGLVSREENPADRRMLLLKATAKGKALLAELREARTSHFSAILARLTLEELSALARGLTAVAKAAERDKEKN